MANQMFPSQVNGIAIPYAATYDELCEYLKTPDALAWAACIALGHLETSDALTKLIELSQSSDWRFRRIAIDALAYDLQAKKAIEPLRAALRDSSPYVIRTACKTIAKIKLVELHDNVVALLKSNDPATRQSAVKALDEIWQVTDFDEAFGLLLSDKVAKVRNEAAWTLRAHATNENWMKLFEVWWQDSVIRHRKWACELALMFDAHKVKNELEQLSSDKDGHVRKAALKALEHPQP
jgi:HEAT repeat protein